MFPKGILPDSANESILYPVTFECHTNNDTLLLYIQPECYTHPHQATISQQEQALRGSWEAGDIHESLSLRKEMSEFSSTESLSLTLSGDIITPMNTQVNPLGTVLG